MCRSVPRPFHPRSGASRLDHPTHSTRSDQGRGASSQQTIDGQCNSFSRPGPSTPDEPTRPTRVDRINLSPDSKLYGAPHFRKGPRTPKTRDLGPKTRFRKFASPDSARNNTMRANLAWNFPSYFVGSVHLEWREDFSKLVQTAGLWYGGGGEHYTLLRPSAVVSALRFADPRSFSVKSVLKARSRLATRPRRSL